MKTDSDLVLHARVGQLLFFPRAAECIATVEMYDGRRSGFEMKLRAPGETTFGFPVRPTRDAAIRAAEAQLIERVEGDLRRAKQALARAEQAQELLAQITAALDDGKEAT